MLRFIWRFFRSINSVKPGIYEFRKEKNPFDIEQPHRVEVIAVRDGWVNYKWLDTTIWQNETMKIGAFRYCYRRMEVGNGK